MYLKAFTAYIYSQTTTKKETWDTDYLQTQLLLQAD